MRGWPRWPCRRAHPRGARVPARAGSGRARPWSRVVGRERAPAWKSSGESSILAIIAVAARAQEPRGRPAAGVVLERRQESAGLGRFLVVVLFLVDLPALLVLRLGEPGAL